MPRLQAVDLSEIKSHSLLLSAFINAKNKENSKKQKEYLAPKPRGLDILFIYLKGGEVIGEPKVLLKN